MITAGTPVTVLGGFEDGVSGTVIRRQPAEAHRPDRVDIAVPAACPYCGRGPCTGSPRTANGADIDRWYRHHPRSRFITLHGIPLARVEPLAEH